MKYHSLYKLFFTNSVLALVEEHDYTYIQYDGFIFNVTNDDLYDADIPLIYETK